MEEGRRSKKKQKYRRDVDNGGDLSGRRKQRRQESVGSVDVDREYLDNKKKAGREVQGAQGLSKYCRKSVSSLSRLVRGFRSRYR